MPNQPLQQTGPASRLFADIASKRLATIRLLVLHFKEAERLLRTYALSARLRTLDSLQLAVAVDLRSRIHPIHDGVPRRTFHTYPA